MIISRERFKNFYFFFYHFKPLAEKKIFYSSEKRLYREVFFIITIEYY